MATRKTNSSNYLNQEFLESRCALNELIYLLSKRWITDVLFTIEEGNDRFSSIKEALEHITDHILSDRLKLLEKNGLISKQQHAGVPAKVTYALTDKGMELSNMLESLCHFAGDIFERDECAVPVTVEA
ncbi:transcriptional regulator [Chitinophaga parva]|uniref:Transcriptional regulator n=1 Tax=Chitinophaga parva TaxID=2169414 RepID=A0A2T7BDA1_9BACT|nr:helix-turn-helix domain-containing protein [Chitinophaga parva]PUZ23074.1 transcriptional regulator [Chitinophaga parva]